MFWSSYQSRPANSFAIMPLEMYSLILAWGLKSPCTAATIEDIERGSRQAFFSPSRGQASAARIARAWVKSARELGLTPGVPSEVAVFREKYCAVSESMRFA